MKKNRYFEPHQNENFYVSKGNTEKAKRQLTSGKKVFASLMSNKRLVSIIYKELLQIDNKQQISPNNPVF